MVLPPVVIKLEPAEVVELRRLTLDADAPGALSFLSNVLLPKVEEILGRGHCRPTFEWGGRQVPPAGPPR